MILIASHKATIWYSLGSLMFALNTVLMLMVVSRVSNLQVTGEFEIAYSISQLLYVIGLFGMNTYQMTDYKKKYSFGNYFFAKLFTSVFMLLICAGFLAVYSYSFTKMIYILLLTLYMLINSFSEVYQSLLFQEDCLAICGQSLFFRTLLSFAAFAAVLYIYGNLTIALVASNLINIIATYLLPVRLSRKFINKADYIYHKDYTNVLEECLPVCISLLLMTFMTNCSKYVIDFRGLDMLQGYYAILFVPVQIINLFSSFIFKPLFMTYNMYIEKRNLKLFYCLFIKQVLFIIAITAIFACMGGLLGPVVMGFVFKAELMQYRTSIFLTVIGGGILAFSALLYYILIIMRLQRKVLYGYLICSIFAIIINIVMIDLYEIIGAAVSFILSYALLSCIFLWIMLRDVKRLDYA